MKIDDLHVKSYSRILRCAKSTGKPVGF